MTQVEPGRLNTRECHLYRFWVRHPLTGEIVLGYIGESGRQPFERLLEHLATQPWFDTVVRWEIDNQIYSGKAAVEAAEAEAIRAELPLYNYEHNLDNPNRIEIWRAKQQRHNRDVQKGRDLWVPRATTKAPPCTPARRTVRRKRRPGLRRLAVWLAVVIACWVGLEREWNYAERWHPIAIPAVTLTLGIWLWLGRPVLPRAWRRARRKLPGWLR